MSRQVELGESGAILDCMMMFPPGSCGCFSEAQHRALSSGGSHLAAPRPEELFHELAARLHGVVEFDYLN